MVLIKMSDNGLISPINGYKSIYTTRMKIHVVVTRNNKARDEH